MEPYSTLTRHNQCRIITVINMAGKKSHLRCALVWERTLLDERVIKPGQRVTVGESTKAMYTLESRAVGKKYTILSLDNSGVTLSLKHGIFGKVTIGGRTLEVEDLANDTSGLAERKGDSVLYRLAPGDGGVLVFGRVGLAFDFIEPPPPPPPSRISQLLDLDGTVSKAFSASLLGIILLSFVSRLFAASPNEFTVEQLPDRFVSFVIDDPESAKDFKKDLKKLEKVQIERNRKRRRDKRTKSSKKTRNTSKSKMTEDDPEMRKIRRKVQDKGMIGAIRRAKKKDDALSSVLDDGGLGMDLNQALRSLEKGGRARVIASAGGSGPILPSLTRRRGTAEAIGEDVQASQPGTGETARKLSRSSRLTGRSEARITLSMPYSAAKVTGGTLSKQAISKVVRSNKGAIRYCYESQLARYPTLRGKIVVDFIIELNGFVKTVKVPTNMLSNTIAAKNVASCLMRFIRRWKFPRPNGGKVRVIYPFTFGRTH